MRIRKWLGIPVSIAIPVCVAGSQELGSNVIPQGLWAAQGDRVLRLTWNAVPGAAAYRISCGTAGRAEAVLGTMPGGQMSTYANGVPRRVSYVIPLFGKEPGVEYRCSLEWATVTGRAYYGKTAFNPITIVPGVLVKPPPGAAPRAFATAMSTSEDEITVTWSPVPGATAYTINREVAPVGFSPFCEMCSTSTTIVDRFTEKSRKHRYSVTPITPVGALLPANSNYVIPGIIPDTTPVTPGTPMISPASLTATITGASSAKVSWIAVRGPATYEVRRYIQGVTLPRIMRVSNDMAGAQIAFPDNLALETKYGASPATVHYTVRSMDAAGKNFTDPVTSNTITVSAKAAQAIALASRNVSNPRATITSPSSVMLTWTPPVGNHLCEIERMLSGRPFGLLARLPIGAYRYVDAMPDLVAKGPSYRIECVSKVPVHSSAVAFPVPAPPG